MTRLPRAGLRADLSSLKFLLSEGEPVDAAAMAEFATAARPCGLDPLAIVPAYGLAEATLAVSFSPRERGLLVDAVDPRLLETDGVAEPARPGHPARQLVRLPPPVSGTSVRAALPDNARLVDDLGLDSLAMMTVLAWTPTAW